MGLVCVLLSGRGLSCFSLPCSLCPNSSLPFELRIKCTHPFAFFVYLFSFIMSSQMEQALVFKKLLYSVTLIQSTSIYGSEGLLCISSVLHPRDSIKNKAFLQAVAESVRSAVLGPFYLVVLKNMCVCSQTDTYTCTLP